MENSKFNIGDKVVVIPERDNKVIFNHRGMTLTVKKTDCGGIFYVEEHNWPHSEENWMKVSEVTPRYEIGKKYIKNTDLGRNSIYTCVDLTLSGIPVMIKGDPNARFLYEGEVLKEYIEPKVYTWYVHWFRNPGAAPYCYTSANGTPPYCVDYLKTDVITYKEELK